MADIINHSMGESPNKDSLSSGYLGETNPMHSKEARFKIGMNQINPCIRFINTQSAI